MVVVGGLLFLVGFAIIAWYALVTASTGTDATIGGLNAGVVGTFIGWCGLGLRFWRRIHGKTRSPDPN
jgi:hypothetical protein